jgi:nucleotide-binding universal stress UspA family protein
MNEIILVPLDGSQYSQCSLSQVKNISNSCHSREVIVLRVVEPIQSDEILELADINESLVSQLENRKKAAALEYVSSIAKILKDEGLPARDEVAYGRADEQIIKFAEDHKVDLIIMSTHGRSGISKWALGGVADRIAHYSQTPVLFVKARECKVSGGF